jgi:hypothetical protein
MASLVRCYPKEKDAAGSTPDRRVGHGVILPSPEKKPPEEHPDPPQDRCDYQEYRQENDGRKDDPLATNVTAFFAMQDSAEKDQIARDGCIAAEVEIAAEDYRSATDMFFKMNVATEDDHVSSYGAFGIDGAEKADDVSRSFAGGYHDVGSEVDSIVSVGRDSWERAGGEQNEECQQSLGHGAVLLAVLDTAGIAARFHENAERTHLANDNRG